jgi:hypothetical protein
VRSTRGKRDSAKHDQRRACGIVATALGLAGLLTGCGTIPAAHQASGTRPEAVATRQRSVAAPVQPAPANVYHQSVLNPSMTVTSAGTYVALQLSPPGSSAVRDELVRIDVTTGQVLASRRISGFVVQVLPAGGYLWVVTSSATNRATLLKLNRRTLWPAAGWHQMPLSAQSTEGYTLAVAGGWLWVADGDRLLRLSLPAGSPTLSVPLPGAGSSDVSADPSGTFLLDGEAGPDGGPGAIQRRDPDTGALLASHPFPPAVAAPMVAGPVDGRVWVTEPTGMMGYIEAFSSYDLAVFGGGCHEGEITSTCIPGDNSVMARIFDGLLWVTDPAGGSMRNYCADPGSGNVLAPIRLPRPAQDAVLAIGGGDVFYAAPAGNGAYVRHEPVPAACRQ